MSLMVPLLLWITYSKKQHPDELNELLEIPSMPLARALLWFVIGLAFLVLNAEILVWGAKTIAVRMGISPLVIGLTIVAVGTSLPELAASVTSAIKGHHDIAIGNVIGSNIFNLLLVMGIPTIIKPIIMDPVVFSRDFLAMLGLTLILGGFMLFSYLKSKRNHCQLSRLVGLALLLLYGAYYTLLF